MNKAVSIAAVASLLYFAYASASAAESSAVRSLCTQNEILLFTCEKDHKLASVCASTSFSSRKGYIQFRYGVADAIEIEWPEKGSSHQYVTKGNLFYSSKMGTYLRFLKNRESYVVFSVPRTITGLVIERNSRVSEKWACPKDSMAESGTLPLPISDTIAVSGVDEK